MTGSRAKTTGLDQRSLQREIRDAERALYRAQVAGNVDALRPMLGADLVYVHSTGVAETRDAYLDGVASGIYEYGEIGSRDTRLQVFDGVAIMNGVVDMTVSGHGAAKTLIHLLFCLIWTREDGSWRLDYRQATRIPPDRATSSGSTPKDLPR
jgi:hypothetical protein